MPWKNGGGLTREVVAVPEGAALGDFDWRISTAEVRAAGPFSIFPGVQRTLCVLQGTLMLEIEGMRPGRLTEQSAPYVFSGDVPAHASPGPEGVIDLNVMTRRGRFAARVTRVDLATSAARDCGPDVTVIFACTPMSVTVDGSECRLGRWDALGLTTAASCTLAAPGGEGACYFIEITSEGRGRIGANAERHGL